MVFSKEMLTNQIFDDNVMTMNYIKFEGDPKGMPERAAVLQEDGSWNVYIFAPEAKRAEIVAEFKEPSENGRSEWRDDPVIGVKNSDGIFEFTIPASKNKGGPRNINLYLDGTLVIWPWLPTMFSGNRVVNYLEFPAHEMEFSYIKDVPHGSVTNELFWSKAMDRWERCIVYTPPGYMKNNEHYPVMYLLHGGGDNETSWVSKGRAQYILDNLIAEGKCVPMILVMANCMYRYDYSLKIPCFSQVDRSTEDNLLYSCIPHIEENYRVRADKWNRAIAGLSLGALIANDIGLGYPEIFGNVGTFTSSMYHTNYTTLYERPWEKAIRDKDSFIKNYKVFFGSATPQEDHMDFFSIDDGLMHEAGIANAMEGYRYIYYDSHITRWEAWRMGLRDFAQMLFR